MIDSIGNTGGFRPPPPNGGASNLSASLTSDDKSPIESTLSNYDSTQLTEEQAINLVQTFGDAGIRPSYEFAEILAESGFDAREIGSLAHGAEAGPSGHRPPPPTVGSQANSGLDLSSVVSYLDELSSNQDNASATTSSIAAKLASQFGLSEGQSLINVIA